LRERGEHRLAIAEYQRVLRGLRGDNRVLAPVLRELGQAQLDAGEAEAALETLRRALRLAGRTSGVRAEIYDVLVEAYRRAERLPELALELERVGARDFQAVELLARIHDELGDAEAALEAYRRAARLDRRHLDTRMRIIQLLSRSGRMDEAIDAYRELVRVAPREPRFVVELARLLMQVGRGQEARRLAEQTSRRHRRDPALHQALAELYADWGEDALATQEIGILVQIDPRDPSHRIALGEQQLERGDVEAALATWERILTAIPDRGQAHALIAAILLDHAMLEPAEAHARRALEADPTSVLYLRSLAEILERPRDREPAAIRMRRDDEALECWTRVVAAVDGDRALRREARQRLVGIWSRRRRLAQQIAQWEASFLAEPPDLEAGRYLAEAYLRTTPRRVERAAEILARLVQLEPGDVESLLALERTRTLAGDLPGAIEALRLLVEADPRRAASYLARMAEHAHALYMDGEAIAYAAEAVARNPTDAASHRRLGELYRARQEIPQAIESFRRVIELDDRRFGTYFELAELHRARGEIAEADALFRAVVRRSTDDDLVARAARASMELDSALGTLEALEGDLLPLSISHTRRTIFRKLVVDVYDAMLSPRIEQSLGPEGGEARATLHRFGARAIKPLLEALADETPTQRGVALRLLPHLGNENAVD
ncbi:MAG: tetratricopeptide repeat protein, partial [Myxococcales bacterium]|nr:tetratricopeptide repeat protein [Myxococcales bacterium]